MIKNDQYIDSLFTKRRDKSVGQKGGPITNLECNKENIHRDIHDPLLNGEPMTDVVPKILKVVNQNVH